MRPSAARLPVAPATATGIRPAFIVQGALLGATLVIYGLVLSHAGLHQQDLGAYLRAGHDLLAGRPLYDPFLHHPFPDPTLRPAYIYPPIFALLASPLALLPTGAAGAIWLVINQVSLAASIAIALLWRRPGRSATVAVIAVTLTFYPLWIDAAQGQANLLILLLVTAGIVGVLADRPHAAAALGFAAALKLTPGLLLAWLLLERRFRDALWMAIGFLAATGAGALVRGQDTVVFFTRVAPALAGGTAVYANQSLNGLLKRVLSVNPYTQPWAPVGWTTLVLVLAALALIAFWLVATRRDDAAVRAWSFLPLLPLLSSVTWPHHLVIVLPVIWFGLIAVANRRWPLAPSAAIAAVVAGFSALARWSPGPTFGQAGFKAAQTGDVLVFFTANALLFSTLVLFLLSPWLLRSR